MPFSLYLRPRLSDRSEETFLPGHSRNLSPIISRLHYWKRKINKMNISERENVIHDDLRT